MDEAARHVRAIYGLDPDVPHAALQFQRLPPGTAHPLFGIHDGAPGRFAAGVASAGQRLQEFQQAYRIRAAGLLAAGPQAVPPGHPLHGGDGTMAALYSERDRLQRENSELRRKLDEKSAKKD